MKILIINKNDVILSDNKSVVTYNNKEYIVIEQINDNLLITDKKIYDADTAKIMKLLNETEDMWEMLQKTNNIDANDLGHNIVV